MLYLQGVNEVCVRGVGHRGGLQKGCPLLLQQLAESWGEGARIGNAASCHHHITHYILQILYIHTKQKSSILRQIRMSYTQHLFC